VPSRFAYLSYHDAPAAIDWLQAIGFRVVTRQPGEDGTVLHAELSRGDAVVMLATADAGATAVLAPETTEWGTERARVPDPEGHEWSFGTYEPGHSW
jgi:uncharacterized glyoxalase superfamily protein PhnB